MPWNDYDYLVSCYDRMSRPLRKQAMELEQAHDYKADIPEVEALLAFEEHILTVSSDSKLSESARLDAARLLLVELNALGDASLPAHQRMGMATALEEAISNEERNLDPSEPFRF